MDQTQAFGRFRRSVNWRNVAMVTFFHLAAIPVIYTFSWQNLAALLIGNWVVGSLGVGLGWHRLLTHRSFKAPKWLEYVLTILGSMSMQDSHDKWVATHRIHHKFVDTDEDPHSARSGFWWPQIGWVVYGRAQDHDTATLDRYIPDLRKDPVHRLIARLYLLPIAASAVILFLIGGWSMVVWGVPPVWCWVGTRRGSSIRSRIFTAGVPTRQAISLQIIGSSRY